MVARSVLVAFLFLGMGLAGCLGGSDADGQVETATTNDTFSTEAPKGRGTIVAFEETNQTEEGIDGVDHHHDYWQGRTRVVIFEREAAMQPFPGSDGASATFTPPAAKEGEPPAMVFEGTSHVEFTLSNPQRRACEPLVTFGGELICTDNLDYHTPAPKPPAVEDPTGGPSGLKLRYQHASTTQWIDAGDIAWGTPVIIKITDPIQTDMPHATSSVWKFQVISPNREDATLKFNAKAEIVKGEGDIPLWPGHPLFYTEDKPSRVVVNNVQDVACDGSGCALVSDEGPVVPDKIISYGTRAVWVYVNVTEFTANNPALAPSAWFLYHNNASSQQNITNPFDFDNYGIEKRELLWVLPVDDNGMDSPYADGSRWKFELGASYTTPENPARRLSCYGGCAEWSAKYTMTVIATSVAPTPEEVHMYCLRGDVHCPTGADEGRR